MKTVNRTLRSLVTLALVVTGLTLAAPEAEADPGAGSLSLLVSATLPTFPCSPPSTCAGSFTGSVTGELSGVHALVNPWWAHVVLAPVSGSFTYSDSALNCASGTASGSGSINVGDPETFGAYGAFPTPQGVTGFRATFGFLYERFGTTAVLTIHSLNIDINTTTSGWLRVISNGLGNGAAQFIPLFQPLLDTPDCVNFTHTSSVVAIVTGDINVAGA